MKLPTVEVRYKNLCVEAKCEVVKGKPLPTLWNSLLSSLSVSIPRLQSNTQVVFLLFSFMFITELFQLIFRAESLTFFQ